MERLEYGKFYTYIEMESYLKSMAEEHPYKMRLESLAETPEGRQVYLVTLANFDEGDKAEKKGAYYVKAGVHAQETPGPTAAMAVIERVLRDTPEILQDVVFYIIPLVNPDGMEFAISKKCGIIRSKFIPVQNQPNALIPQDINGDGMILDMRRKNPAGNMKELADYPGIMVPREPGDTDGEFYDVWCEGIIEDYDGGEPVLARVRGDFNRAYPVMWKPNPGAEYPFRYPELRAVAEFEVTHLNIFAMVDFHGGSNAIFMPQAKPGIEDDPEDFELMKRIGRIAEELTGFPLLRRYDDCKDSEQKRPHPNGTSNAWNYYALGRSTYNIELGKGTNSIGYSTYELVNTPPEEKPRHLGEVRDFHEAHGSDVFVPWQPFEHPQLGKVEIGGFKEGNCRQMYAPDLEKILPNTTEFIIRHAAMTPKVRVVNSECIKVAEDIFRIRVDIMNVGKLGTRVMRGIDEYGSYEKVRTRIIIKGNATLLSTPAVYEHDELKPVERIFAEWFVRAEKGSEVTVTSENPRSIPAVATFNL